MKHPLCTALAGMAAASMLTGGALLYRSMSDLKTEYVAYEQPSAYKGTYVSAKDPMRDVGVRLLCGGLFLFPIAAASAAIAYSSKER